jgi:hypothetical protein
MTPRLVIAAVALCALTAACTSANAGPSHRGGPTSTPGTPTPSSCVPRAGGRCPGPASVDSALLGELYLASRSQLSISGLFLCGGRLHAKESPDRVTITYIASRVRGGAMTCAKVPLSVRLAAPLAGRTVVDGVSGQVLTVGVLPNA